MSKLYFILILFPYTLALIKPPSKNTLSDDEINKLVAEIGKLDTNFSDLKSTADPGYLKKVFYEIIAHFNPNYKIPAENQLTKEEKSGITKRLEKINKKYQKLKDLKLQWIDKLSNAIQKIEDVEKAKFNKGKPSANEVDEEDTTNANDEASSGNSTALAGNDEIDSSTQNAVNDEVTKASDDKVSKPAAAANDEVATSTVAADDEVDDDDMTKPTSSSA